MKVKLLGVEMKRFVFLKQNRKLNNNESLQDTGGG